MKRTQGINSIKVQNILTLGHEKDYKLHLIILRVKSVTMGYTAYVQCFVSYSCPTLCDFMDCGLPGSSVHGILQARILEWVAMPSSRGSSPPREQTQVSHIAGRFFITWATGKPYTVCVYILQLNVWIAL